MYSQIFSFLSFQDTGKLTRSEPLRIDTTHDINKSIINSNLEQIQEIENELHESENLPLSQSSSASSTTSDTISSESTESDFSIIFDMTNTRYELVLGIVSAIVVFAVILVFFIITIKRRSPSDKQSLIENEIRDDSNIQTVHV